VARLTEHEDGDQPPRDDRDDSCRNVSSMSSPVPGRGCRTPLTGPSRPYRCKEVGARRGRLELGVAGRPASRWVDYVRRRLGRFDVSKTARVASCLLSRWMPHQMPLQPRRWTHPFIAATAGSAHQSHAQVGLARCVGRPAVSSMGDSALSERVQMSQKCRATRTVSSCASGCI